MSGFDVSRATVDYDAAITALVAEVANRAELPDAAEDALITALQDCPTLAVVLGDAAARYIIARHSVAGGALAQSKAGG